MTNGEKFKSEFGIYATELWAMSEGDFLKWLKAKAEPRWVPIEQDCPERGKDVLISHNGVVSIDWLTQSEGVGYFFISGVAVQDVDAWMPLPQAYGEAEE